MWSMDSLWMHSMAVCLVDRRGRRAASLSGLCLKRDYLTALRNSCHTNPQSFKLSSTRHTQSSAKILPWRPSCLSYYGRVPPPYWYWQAQPRPWHSTCPSAAYIRFSTLCPPVLNPSIRVRSLAGTTPSQVPRGTAMFQAWLALETRLPSLIWGTLLLQ